MGHKEGKKFSLLGAFRYSEQRCRLLPHLEKDHNHARVPYEDLQARLTTQLVASPVSPIALLHWQTSGKGSPFQLSESSTKPSFSPVPLSLSFGILCSHG